MLVGNKRKRDEAEINENGNEFNNDNGNGDFAVDDFLEENLIDHKADLDQVVITYKNNEGDYVEFDDLNSGDLTIVKGVKKLYQVYAFGLVINADNQIYENERVPMNERHVPIHPQRMVYIIEKMFKDMTMEIKQIIVGHEHGSFKGKCHYQIVVDLYKPTSRTIKPFVIVDDTHKVHGTSQNAKNSNALKNYCKKEGDFYYLDNSNFIEKVYKKNSKGEVTDKVDPFATIIKNSHKLDKDGCLDILKQYDANSFFKNFKNVEAACLNVSKPQIPEFQWVPLPEDRLKDYPLIKKWYYNDCINVCDSKGNPVRRRKALCLYSKERAMGKTELIKGLVNHEDYCVIFRGTFSRDFIDGKIPKLLILDDMTKYDDKNKETWKALVASQQTSIRDAYLNYSWKHEIPCVITTNDYNLFMNMRANPEFNTQVYFVKIRDYIGPPEFRPDNLNIIEDNFDDEDREYLQRKLDERKAYIETIKLKTKLFGVKGDSNEVEELRNTILNLKVENDNLRIKYNKLNGDYESLKNNPIKVANNDYNIALFKKREEEFEEKIRSLKCQLDMATNDLESYQFTNNNLITTNYTLINQLKKQGELEYVIDDQTKQIDGLKKIILDQQIVLERTNAEVDTYKEHGLDNTYLLANHRQELLNLEFGLRREYEDRIKKLNQDLDELKSKKKKSK